MNFVVPDFAPAAAELFVASASLVVLLVTVFAKSSARSLGYLLTLATLVVAAFITWSGMSGEVAYTFSNMYIDDPMSDVLKLMVYGSMAVVLLYSRQYLADRDMDRPEFYLLVIYATLGMMVMISANHLLTVYVGLEMLSLSLYGLVAIDRDSARSTEAAMKYFVLGALASGLLLYGMSMIYGATGSLELSGIMQATSN
ncbi:MAG: NADH:ubiquinone oxidoreductase subunit N, partial [Rhodocyclaceae bacterium]|nr:NADH:ubiquinone oxidoreductase subunit N [Rhodocyclaceae bacterium]